jgi:hypothetical protein
MCIGVFLFFPLCLRQSEQAQKEQEKGEHP